MHTYDFTNAKRSPVSIAWDDIDDRMLCCEAVRHRAVVALPPKKRSENQAGEDAGAAAADVGASAAAAAAAAAAADLDGESEVEVVIFFATTEHGLLLQDSFPRKTPLGSLLGLSGQK